ncbi:MAG TPA: heavy metal translocating P-type ATPase [Chloroflexota bacterium]|nr:heavy metal translocating P-type ATPase [Chloroflexota bacterium]
MTSTVRRAAGARIVHHVPGRLRLHAPALRREPGLADRIIAVGMAHAGVRAVRVNLPAASVAVEYDPAALTPSRALVRRWVATGPAALPPPAALGDGSGPRQGGEGAGSAWRRLVPLAASAAGLALALLGGPAGPPLALALTALGALPIARRAVVASARERRLSVDHLDSAAVALMLALGDVVGAALMTALVAGGEEIRDRTARRSRRAALDLRAALGRRAWLVRAGQKLQVAIDELRVGDVVVVYPGDLIPVDGLVIDGTAAVDQKALTGESKHVLKTIGDQVLAATVVADGKLYVRATAVGDGTRAGWIVRTLQDAPMYDTRAANYAARFGDRLVLPTFGLAGAAYLLTRNPARAAAILIVDFATGIRVAAPTTVLATMTRAARDGILIKGGRAIEQLAAADAVLFDKTGTLTRGEPEVSEVVSVDGELSDEQVLALSAAAEVRLRHPAARALVRHARGRGIGIPERQSSHYTTGLGVVAGVDGHTVHVGSGRFVRSAGIETGAAAHPAARLAARGASVVYVAVDDRLVGVVGYHDPPRPEAPAVVAWLRRHGVRELLMVTGDEPAAARAIARSLGIDRVHASALPHEKAEMVRELQRRGHVVAVVGDGINDSPALALADVSISMRHGADVARETADVVLVEPHLWGIAQAIELSRGALGLIRQNLALVGLPNAAAMALAATGAVSPLGATLISNGSTVVAAMNSLRPLATNGRARGHAAAP